MKFLQRYNKSSHCGNKLLANRFLLSSFRYNQHASTAIEYIGSPQGGNTRWYSDLFDWCWNGTFAFIDKTKAATNSVQNFYYICRVKAKRVARWRAPSPQYFACGQHSSYWRNDAAVESRWQHQLQFNLPEIWTSDIPLHRRTRYHPDQLAGYRNKLNQWNFWITRRIISSVVVPYFSLKSSSQQITTKKYQ